MSTACDFLVIGAGPAGMAAAATAAQLGVSTTLVDEQPAPGGQIYRNVPFGITVEAPKGWTLDNSRSQTLVTFTGPTPEIRGQLQKSKRRNHQNTWNLSGLLRRQSNADLSSGLLAARPAQKTRGLGRYEKSARLFEWFEVK